MIATIRWWCSSVATPWSWSWQAYPGVWLAVALLVVPYGVSMWRRRGPNPDARRRLGFFAAGAVVLWLATDWPLGVLGASYLAFVHMIQYVMYTMIAAPLLLLGVPEWMGRRLLGRLRLYRVAKWVAMPIRAGLVFNALLLLTHAPWVVDTFRPNQFGSLGLDALWLLSGLVFWLPIVSPLPELVHQNHPVKMAYLFLAGGVVPALPGGFLTFATFPLYATYELAPRVGDISAGTDQSAAGLVMKLGGMPVIWGTMLALMLKWSEGSRERAREERLARAAAQRAAADQGGSDPPPTPDEMPRSAVSDDPPVRERPRDG